VADRAVITVVGLGPGGPDLLTRASEAAIVGASNVVFRTLRHPAVTAFGDVASYDEHYERAESFDELYAGIVDDLVQRAVEHGPLVYVVPGSPVVAERTVELLVARDDVELTIEPALSFVDVAWAVLKIDPMSSGVRIVDATSIGERLRGPGPLLITQCYNQRTMVDLKLAIDASTNGAPCRVVILHHLGLADQNIVECDASELDRFESVDHLTSVFVPELRTVGEAAEDLFDLMERLRRECPWDQKQTHESLSRHLLEESYELLEALDALVAVGNDEARIESAYLDVEEELGDVVFQVVFHACLASEEGRFDLTDVMDHVRTKLVGRHPHVFGDVDASTPDEVAANWETIKRAEKQRSSVTEGIPAALPATMRYSKLRRKANSMGLEPPALELLVASLTTSLRAIVALEAMGDDATSTQHGAEAVVVGDLLAAGLEIAQILGIDAESVLRSRADDLQNAIIEVERNRE
jgi:tetrapyrrole methylase family protein / MazG family protein